MQWEGKAGFWEVMMTERNAEKMKRKKFLKMIIAKMKNEEKGKEKNEKLGVENSQQRKTKNNVIDWKLS